MEIFCIDCSIKGQASEHREIIDKTHHYDHAQTHNVYIQDAYNAGISIGATYLIAVVYIGVSALAWF